jgi:hypothetical protein
MSICLTAEELALTVNELKEMHYNRTWTTRKQQQQHQDRITDAPALDSSQQHSHPVTGLHDISAFTSALKLQANHLPRPQKHTSTCTQRPWPNNRTLTTFSASKQHQQPNMACDTGNRIKSMITPNPLAFSLPKQWQQLTNGTGIGTSDKPNNASTVSNPLSRPWKITLSWITWLKMQKVSLP